MALMVLRVHLSTQKLTKTITHTCAIRRNRLKFVTVNLHYVSSVENERKPGIEKSLNEATDVKEDKGAKYSVGTLKDCDHLIKLHTGLDSYALFEWTYDQVKHKLDYLQYYKGPNSHTVKRYQANKGKKPGPQRML